VLLRRAGERPGHRVHPALGEEDPGDGVHVGDDGVDGQGVVRGEPGVHRLEGQHPLGPGVLEVALHLGREPAEAADRGQPGQVRRQQVEGGVDVAVDEVLHLVAVELGDEVDVLQVALGLGRSADPLDLVGHLPDVGLDVQRRPVRVVRAVERVHRLELEPVLELLAHAVEGVGDEVRHRQHGRAGVEAVGPVTGRRGHLEQAVAATGDRFALQHGHLTAGAHQAEGRGQAGQARPDDDDAVGLPRNGLHAGTVGAWGDRHPVSRQVRRWT